MPIVERELVEAINKRVRKSIARMDDRISITRDVVKKLKDEIESAEANLIELKRKYNSEALKLASFSMAREEIEGELHEATPEPVTIEGTPEG